ncbi:MAG: serine--tRNA ligase [Planctomycetaceae bacterium]|nr:serine--tRNA ligase [Planctomycetaceae bacterium]
MLDRKFILQNLAAVQQNCVERGVTCDLQSLVALDQRRKDADTAAQEFNRQANEIAKSIGGLKDPQQRAEAVETGRQLRLQKDAAQKLVDQLEAEIVVIQRTIPNMAHPAAPRGANDQANLEVGRGKYQPRVFDFKVKDHLLLGTEKGWIDFEGGARTTGQGFYFLAGELVLLDLAIQQLAVEHLMQRGFTPTITPDLAKVEILEGIGFMPRGPETQVYSVENTDLCLVGTAEITLGGWYAGQTLEAESLPLRLCGISHCYRTEAGAAGRASRGLYRVHQFTKVEMFVFCLPEQSDAMHEELKQIECDLFDLLEVPYRVVDTATGDLGGPAYRKYDLEAWMPGRGEMGEWGEVTSTSNCTDYQSRRLNVRFKEKDKKGTQFFHTLNGTAFALSRALIAVLENHQHADGSVRIPTALQPYLRRERIG